MGCTGASVGVACEYHRIVAWVKIQWIQLTPSPKSHALCRSPVPYMALLENLVVCKERSLSKLPVTYVYSHFVGSVRGAVVERDVNCCTIIAPSMPWSLSDTQSSLCENTYANFVHGFPNTLRASVRVSTCGEL